MTTYDISVFKLKIFNFAIILLPEEKLHSVFHELDNSLTTNAVDSVKICNLCT